MENLPATGSDDDLIRAMDADLLLAAMDALGTQTREALLLRYREGCSVKDIAEALGISVSAAKVRLSRGLDRLRELFDAAAKEAAA